jgi:hypothetical protein
VAVAFIKEVPLRTTVEREPAADEQAATEEPVVAISAPVLPPAGDGRVPRHAAPDADEPVTGAVAPHVRPEEALDALDDAEQAARDLADAEGRLASSVHRLRTAGFGQQQIDALLARRVAGTESAR